MGLQQDVVFDENYLDTCLDEIETVMGTVQDDWWRVFWFTLREDRDQDELRILNNLSFQVGDGVTFADCKALDPSVDLAFEEVERLVSSSIADINIETIMVDALSDTTS